MLEDIVLEEIRKSLEENWLEKSATTIRSTIDKMPGHDAITRGARHRKKEELTLQAKNEFQNCWNNEIKKQFASQYKILHKEINELLTERHPWISSEKQEENIKTLSDTFLHAAIKKQLFILLENKPRGANRWNLITINQTSKLGWRTFSPENIQKELQGFPLSKPEFYENRALPTYLENPFDKSPTRYDIYRLLIKNYSEKFKAKKLANNIICTKIAPMHVDELATLSKDELAELETIIVNVGNEEDPKWVLLNKRNNEWTLYKPSKPLEFDTSKITLAHATQIIEIGTKNQEDNYSDKCNWDAILFSRVLPWCESREIAKTTLENYRANYPIKLLFQNTLEATCLKAQKKFAEKSKVAFSNRAPFSNKNEQDLYVSHNASTDVKYLIEGIPNSHADKIISILDMKNIIFDTIKSIVVKAEQYIKEALLLAYFNKTSTITLDFTPSAKLNKWFEYNLEINTVIAKEPEKCRYVYACASRNRFLQKFKPDYLNEAEDKIQARHNSWENTGKYILEFFNQEEDLAQSADIAQMGAEGLNSFFNFLSQQHTAANLTCTLDLESKESYEVIEYIKLLENKIRDYNKKPLFKKLSLILPNQENLDAETISTIGNLIKTIQEKGDISEISLQNPTKVTTDFLKNLTEYVSKSNIQIQIKIPIWDDAKCTSTPERNLKTLYRNLQDEILNNIRNNRTAELNRNTKTIIEPPSIAMPLKKDGEPPLAQEWGAQEYQLAATVTGIQQQAQQEVAQEAEQQKEPPTPNKREITPLPDKRKLIDRTNLGEIEEADFSAWVGSQKDGRGIIKFIDLEALAQIQKYPSLFKFGIDSERTPGFRLYYKSAEDKSLVLTFDASLVNEDINNLQHDPFAIRMNDCKPAQTFVGDYRQLKKFTETEQELLTVWKFLAKEDITSEEIKTWLTENSINSETTAALQYQNIHGTNLDARNEETLKNIIIRWSKIKDEDFFNIFFQDFNPENWQAFGQLFYHYASDGNNLWIQLAHQVYQKFPKKFAEFKKYLLDPLYDWSECLEQSEVQALTTSMQKLADHPKHQEILWKLITTHGDSIGGRIRFAEVWQAYDRLITYINNNDLEINYAELSKAIDNYKEEFNATHFLRRIYEVLQATGNRQDSEEIQNEILENLSKIDWHENGFYNACLHEHYRFWDKDLQFTNLARWDGTENPGYSATWDDIELNAISDPDVYTLRYAAQTLKLNKEKFLTFKQIISQIPKNAGNRISIMRLATAFLALGVDNLGSLAEIDWQNLLSAEYQENINKINNLLKLDTPERATKILQLKMHNLATVLTAINDFSPNTELNIEMLNAFSRAIQADKELKLIIKYANKKGYDNIIVNYCPWLIDSEDFANRQSLEQLELNEEQKKFLQQLTSINYEKSQKFPDAAELLKTIESINSKSTRHAAVKKLIQQKCIIENQDAEFSVLSDAGKALFADLFISKTYAKQNRKLLDKLLERLAAKETDNQKISKLLNLFSELGRKSHYDELGQLLGLLIQKSQDGKYYSLEQLTGFLDAAFNEEDFKNKLYPVKFIEQLLTDALQDPESSLLNSDLNKLKTSEDKLDNLKNLIREINHKDLPYRAKKTLVQTAIKFKQSENPINIVEKLTNIFSKLKTYPGVNYTLCEYINHQLSLPTYATLATQINTLEKVAQLPNIEDEILKTLWASSLNKLLTNLKENTLTPKLVKNISEIQDPVTRIIIIEAISTNEQADIPPIIEKLDKLTKEQKNQLAKYYASDPKPNLQQLTTLLKKFPTDIEKAIAHFEKVILPAGKRYYSLTPEDTSNIKRILEGIKLKGGTKIRQSEKIELLNLLYYTNNYSKTISLEQKSYAAILDIIHNNKNVGTPEAKARILACLREVIVRKTGKWMNHTQVLDLLYSVTHDGDNLLHQIRMGEGKSIISLARVAYRALNGQVVDVYSAKDSLSARDHIESAPVLDVLNIRHAHITANSSAEQYHNSIDKQGVGAVHYSTMGGWSLFILTNSWKNQDANSHINLDENFRVAVLDEGDHLMRIEETVFNYSDQTGDSAIYNYDAWAYKITLEYFMEINTDLEKNGFVIQEDPHLKELYRRLQEGAQKIAPPESQIFAKHLATNDKKLRNKKLVDLLTAARLAKSLEEGGPFCVMDEAKEINESTAIDTRFAKVMINSQVYHGSTYSDLVHQFLHTRLNTEAIEEYQTPNFFIEPESEIVLSLITPFVLKHFYKKLEAFTGTPGGLDALDFYRSEFGIQRVIKLPTHEAGKTKFLAPIYCTGENEDAALQAHVQKLVESILNNPDQPILITCEDDREVKILGQLIAAALEQQQRQIVIDTNATGLSEANVLKNAGLQGAITISARLGRGSDIKPYCKKVGLKVLRTYPADPEIVKQEQGRQGRNSADGTCQDIINYFKVSREIERYKKTYSDKFSDIYNREKEHLEQKLTKHAELNNQNKQIWQNIKQNEDLKEQYLQTRTLQKLKHDLKEETKKLQRQKNDLIAEGTALVMGKLINIPAPDTREEFKQAWQVCRRKIEANWSNENGEEAAKQTLHDFRETWQIPPLDKKDITQDLDEEFTADSETATASFEEQIQFHQKWLEGICVPNYNPSTELSAAIYGEQGEYLEYLFVEFAKLNPQQLREIQKIATLAPSCHYIPCKTWIQAINLMSDNKDIEDNFVARLTTFFKKSANPPNNTDELEVFAKNFLSAILGTPDKEFILEIINKKFSGENQTYLKNLVNNKFGRKLIELCKHTLHKEDIIFLLKTLNKYRNSMPAIIEKLENTNNLKSFPAAVRPLISVLAHNPKFEYQNAINEMSAPYLQLLSKRPFTKDDLTELNEKLDRITKDDDKIKFMNIISSIPAHISLGCILEDFDDLPGCSSFEPNDTELSKKRDLICKGANLYVEFLFTNDIVTSTHEITTPIEQELYNNWQDIYAKLSLDMRWRFFSKVATLATYNLQNIEAIANNYIENENSKELNNAIEKLKTRSTIQIPQQELNKPTFFTGGNKPAQEGNNGHPQKANPKK